MCSDAVQDNNPQRLDIITATPRITFGAAFMSQVGPACCSHWEGHFQRQAGFTQRKLDPREDVKLPKEFSIGLVSFYPLRCGDVIVSQGSRADKLVKSSYNRGKVCQKSQHVLLTSVLQQSELSKAEQVAGVSMLLDKVMKFHPRIVCFVGLGIADIVKSDLTLVSSS
jgi:hypothetical protein